MTRYVGVVPWTHGRTTSHIAIPDRFGVMGIENTLVLLEM